MCVFVSDGDAEQAKFEEDGGRKCTPVNIVRYSPLGFSHPYFLVIRHLAAIGCTLKTDCVVIHSYGLRATDSQFIN